MRLNHIPLRLAPACCAIVSLMCACAVPRTPGAAQRPQPPATTTAPNTPTTERPTAGSALAQAQQIWQSLQGEPTNTAAAAGLLERVDPLALRALRYEVPDPMVERAALGDTSIRFDSIRTFRDGMTAIRDHDSPAAAVRAARLIALDQLLAGVMLSTPRPRMTREDISGGNSEPGFAHTNAALRRTLVLKALTDLGDPATSYQPVAKLAAMQEIVKTIGRNHLCDGYAIP